MIQHVIQVVKLLLQIIVLRMGIGEGFNYHHRLIEYFGPIALISKFFYCLEFFMVTKKNLKFL